MVSSSNISQTCLELLGIKPTYKACALPLNVGPSAKLGIGTQASAAQTSSLYSSPYPKFYAKPGYLGKTAVLLYCVPLPSFVKGTRSIPVTYVLQLDLPLGFKLAKWKLEVFHHQGCHGTIHSGAVTFTQMQLPCNMLEEWMYQLRQEQHFAQQRKCCHFR